MKNLIIFEREFDAPRAITAVEVSDEAVTLTFLDGQPIEISSYHSQDCCEHVYADFSVMKYHADELRTKPVRSLTLKRVLNMGFLVCFERGYDSYEKIFIPCYNYQNGYYSSNLSVVLKEGEMKTEVDISDCVEDHIN